MAKNGKFISNSRILLKDGQTVEKGQLLTLEVGDDGMPSQSIYAGRVKPVSEGKADTGKVVSDAKAEAKKIIDDAKEKANEILAKAASGQK